MAEILITNGVVIDGAVTLKGTVNGLEVGITLPWGVFTNLSDLDRNKLAAKSLMDLALNKSEVIKFEFTSDKIIILGGDHIKPLPIDVMEIKK